MDIGPGSLSKFNQRPTVAPKGDEVLGAVSVGIVKEVGPEAKRFKPGEEVFGWAFSGHEESAHLELITVRTGSFRQFFNTMITDLGLPAPWPRPADYVSSRADQSNLIWGTAPSVGQQALLASTEIQGEVQPAVPMVIDCIGSQIGTLKADLEARTKGNYGGCHTSGDFEARFGRYKYSSFSQNPFFKGKLATEMMPALLAEGVVKP
ncbi:hypothetical protein BJ170DRAFT_733073 [Xylariales sp. AK1849]|nr:hypothetical protein BJ170DRAFT_733073 [Xylariales sp. AK1849]